jgi:TatD DNase family protein
MQPTQPHRIDSHFHLLSIARKGVELPSLLDQMQELGMEGLDIGTDAEDLAQRYFLTKEHPFIRLSAGIGPWGVAEGNKPITEQLEHLHSQIQSYPVAAIGEIGLDNHWNYGTKALQEELLEQQIDLAQALHKPVIFHNREADAQFMDVLGRHVFPIPGLFHCFQGSKELAFLAVEKGFYLSFAGPLTYRANTAMQELFSDLPLDHLLLETDSPYLSPNPVRGKMNTPLNMQYIYAFAAQLRRMDEAALQLHISENFHRFLNGR